MKAVRSVIASNELDGISKHIRQREGKKEKTGQEKETNSSRIINFGS